MAAQTQAEVAARPGNPVRVAMVTTAAITLRSFLLPYAGHLRARGWQVHGIAADATSCADCRNAFDHVHDVPWSRSMADLRGAVSGYNELQRLARRWAFDLVHVHTPIAAFCTRLALRNVHPRPRVVYTAHGFHFHEGGGALSNALFRFLERTAGRWTDRLIVINSDDRQAALEHRIVAPGQVVFMPGIGVQVDDYAVGATDADPLAGVIADRTTDTPVFLCVAEFIARKRHLDLVTAFHALGNANAHLLLAGDGPERDRVLALAQRLGIASRVHLLGYRRDVPALLRSSTALVLVSEQEGLPRSVMEAMAAGVPVIGSDIRGIRDLIGGGAGWLVPVGDAAAIARAMRELVESPARARAAVATARARIEEFSLPRLLALHDRLYDELLGLSNR